MHEFRNPDRYQVLELRELIRGRKHRPMPSARDGLVVEDLDLVIRWYGPRFGLDAVGRFRLCEVKHDRGIFTPGQRHTFGLIARHMAGWDRFDGFFLIRSSDEDHTVDTKYEVNGQALTCDEFLDWLITPVSEIPSMFDNQSIPPAPLTDPCPECGSEDTRVFTVLPNGSVLCACYRCDWEWTQ